MKVNGNKTISGVMECTNILTAVDMRAIGSATPNVVKENLNILMMAGI
jgi:hypothetical protein